MQVQTHQNLAVSCVTAKSVLKYWSQMLTLTARLKMTATLADCLPNSNSIELKSAHFFVTSWANCLQKEMKHYWPRRRRASCEWGHGLDNKTLHTLRARKGLAFFTYAKLLWVFLKKIGPITDSFLFIFVFSTCHNLNSNLNWLKCR